MKTAIIASRAGRVYQKLQSLKGMRSVLTHNPEQSGMAANARIADRLVHRLCKPGGTFVDIGAQYGAVFGPAHQNDPSIKVIAFEADPQKADALRVSYPYAQVIGLAVGETPGQATFYLNLEASGFNSLVPSEDPKLRRISVEVVRLDDVIPETRPDVIKIDVEGAELGVLRGGTRVIGTSRPVIMFECVLQAVNALGYCAGGLWDWLDANGFYVFTPDRMAHEAPCLAREVFLDAQQYPFRSHNYFAVPKERVGEIRAKARDILGVVPT